MSHSSKNQSSQKKKQGHKEFWQEQRAKGLTQSQIREVIRSLPATEIMPSQTKQQSE